MSRRERAITEGQFSLYDEVFLLTHLSEQQSELVSTVLDEAARTGRVSEENARLASDLAGSRDRLQEVHHRVRNHLQTVTGLLSAHQISETSPTARRALQKSIGRLTSIAAIHDLLARDPASGNLRLPDLARRLAAHLIGQAGAEQRIRVHTDVAALTLDSKQATAFVLILTELLSNAVEHGFGDDGRGEIFLQVDVHDGEAVLEMRDTGRGLPAGFDIAEGNSLGLRLVGRLAERDLGGSLDAYNDGGACFRVTFVAGPLGEET